MAPFVFVFVFVLTCGDGATLFLDDDADPILLGDTGLLFSDVATLPSSELPAETVIGVGGAR